MIELYDEDSSTIVDVKKERKKYLILNIMSKCFYVIFGIALFLAVIFFPLDSFSSGVLSGLLTILVILLPILGFFFTAFFSGKIANKFYNEFDYALVSGTLRFSKVIFNKKRKFLFQFDCSNIERMGKYNSPDFEKFFKMPNVKKNILTSNETPNENKGFYYIYCTFGGEKHLIVLECAEHFIANILKFTNVIVWERVENK